jgi:hypothetical protein
LFIVDIRYASAGFLSMLIPGFHEPFLPHNQGFDHYFGLLHNLDPVETVYFEDQGGVPLMRGREVVKRAADPAELTKLYTDEAIDFIEANEEAPFLLPSPYDASQSAGCQRGIQRYVAMGRGGMRFRNWITTLATFLML